MKKIFRILILFFTLVSLSLSEENFNFTIESKKIIYEPGEKIEAVVKIKNNTKEKKEVILKLWIESEIDEKTKDIVEKVELLPGEEKILNISFPYRLKKYGHAIVGQIILNNQILKTCEDYFNICDNYWNVALIAPCGFIWQQFDNKFNPKEDFNWVNDMIKKWRKEYYNGFEKFFWAEDDFLGLTPEREMWWSGQARYLETKKGLKKLIEEGHKNGMKAITYAKCTGGGPYGVEMARKHPEWVWHDKGTLCISRQVKKLAIWDITTEKHWGGWIPVDWNMNDPKVVEIGIKALINSTYMFGWDGARWDGNFDVRREIYDFDGNLIEKLTPEQVDERNAENMRKTKEMILKEHPKFVFGYNWANPLPLNKETIELCKGGGLIMNEWINQSHGVQHPQHSWDKFIKLMCEDTQIVKKFGGYYGPILGSLQRESPLDEKYKNIFAYASGAHPYYFHYWGGFITRYSAFIWDNKLEKINKPKEILSIPENIWWENWVYERPVEKNKKQIIVHLINPPTKPNVGESKNPEDAPAPIKNAEIKISKTLLGNWKLTRTVVISPEPFLKEDLKIEEIKGVYTLKIPEIVLWNILIINFEKRGG